MQSNDGVNLVGSYFNENWTRYQTIIKNNTLFHQEMFSALKSFLIDKAGSRPCSFVDVGCGDASAISPIISNLSISHYIGIDAAEDVLNMAKSVLSRLTCEKTFIADNMTTAITRISSPVDIIFTSYAVHHLSLQDKVSFIKHCQSLLQEGGCLLMIDAVIPANQTRHRWLELLKERMTMTMPELTPDEITERMAHPYKSDFPETIKTFYEIAKRQSWSSFDVLLDKGAFAFMVFSK